MRNSYDQMNKVTTKRAARFLESCEPLGRELKGQVGAAHDSARSLFKGSGASNKSTDAAALSDALLEGIDEARDALQAFVNFLHASMDLECTNLIFEVRQKLNQSQWTAAVRAVTCGAGAVELSWPAKNLFVYHTTDSRELADLLIEVGFRGSVSLMLVAKWSRAAHRKSWVQPLEQVIASEPSTPLFDSPVPGGITSSQRHSWAGFPAAVVSRALRRRSAV